MKTTIRNEYDLPGIEVYVGEKSGIRVELPYEPVCYFGLYCFESHLTRVNNIGAVSDQKMFDFDFTTYQRMAYFDHISGRDFGAKKYYLIMHTYNEKRKNWSVLWVNAFTGIVDKFETMGMKYREETENAWMRKYL